MDTSTDKLKINSRLRNSAVQRLASGDAPTSHRFVSLGALSFLHKLVSSSPVSSSSALTLLHEMQVHQVELDLQNEQFEFSTQELTEDLKRYKALYDNAPFGYCILTGLGYIIECNRVGSELLGVPPGNIEGCALEYFLALESRQTFAAVMKLLQSGSCRETCQIRIKGIEPERSLQLMAIPSDTAGLYFITLIDPGEWLPEP